MLDFGTQLRPSWRQNGAQNRSTGAKRLKESIWGAHFLRSWKRPASRNRFGALPGTILVDFGLIFNWILMDLWSILSQKSCIPGPFFCVCFCNFSESLEKSNKTKQDQIRSIKIKRSNKINQTNARHKPPCTTCHDGVQIAELQITGACGDTPHGVFNEIFDHTVV